MCKTVENYAMNYAMDYAKKERLEAIRNMLKYGVSREKILEDYSEEEIEKAEKAMLVQV